MRHAAKTVKEMMARQRQDHVSHAPEQRSDVEGAACNCSDCNDKRSGSAGEPVPMPINARSWRYSRPAGYPVK